MDTKKADLRSVKISKEEYIDWKINYTEKTGAIKMNLLIVLLIILAAIIIIYIFQNKI